MLFFGTSLLLSQLLVTLFKTIFKKKGYGDINVKATFSRFLIFFILCFGLILASIWVSVFLGFIDMDNIDKLIYVNNELVENYEEMKVPAAKMIYNFYKMYKACESPHLYDFEKRKNILF